MTNQPPSSAKEQVLAWVRIVYAKYRLFFNHCPECNDDAPRLYNCPVCLWYRHNTERYKPFSKSMKERLLEDFIEYHTSNYDQ